MAPTKTKKESSEASSASSNMVMTDEGLISKAEYTAKVRAMVGNIRDTMNDMRTAVVGENSTPSDATKKHSVASLTDYNQVRADVNARSAAKASATATVSKPPSDVPDWTKQLDAMQKLQDQMQTQIQMQQQMHQQMALCPPPFMFPQNPFGFNAPFGSQTVPKRAHTLSFNSDDGYQRMPWEEDCDQDDDPDENCHDQADTDDLNKDDDNSQGPNDQVDDPLDAIFGDLEDRHNEVPDGTGPPVPERLAQLVTKLMRLRLKFETVERMYKTIDRPENIEGLKPIDLNLFIYDICNTAAQRRDRSFQWVQDVMMKTGTCMAKVLDILTKKVVDDSVPVDFQALCNLSLIHI